MAEAEALFDDKSKLWLQPFSELINTMFPVEMVYADWFFWQGRDLAFRYDQESIFSTELDVISTGSLVEGLFVPEFMVHETAQGFSSQHTEQWNTDTDQMKVQDCCFTTDNKLEIPLFSVEHAADNPRYVHLRITDEVKEYLPKFKNVNFLNHAYLIPDFREANKIKCTRVKESEVSQLPTYEIHGPVSKSSTIDKNPFVPDVLKDIAEVFKYPLAWPEQAMEWLVRPRKNSWPSPELVQDIFESGCHLAPVGRGKRIREPIEFAQYHRNPEQAEISCLQNQETQAENQMIMDETEWRLSFSVAENKLGQSVSPVQRHVLILLKMIKKAYFPDLISSYLLKNLLFWEIEKQEESFWTEGNSGKCLLMMLDRLQKSLEEGHLPHYILPQSNLLQYEDPVKIAEGAVVISDVRRNILSKTFSLIRRCESYTVQSASFLRDIDIDLDSYISKVQDKNLAENDVKELTSSLIKVFTARSRNMVIRMLGNVCDFDEEEKKAFYVCIYAHQSLLARNLCKLWFLKPDKKNEEKTNESEFISFVKEEIVKENEVEVEVEVDVESLMASILSKLLFLKTYEDKTNESEFVSFVNEVGEKKEVEVVVEKEEGEEKEEEGGGGEKKEEEVDRTRS